MLFIEYPKCSTCQKAKKWLDDHGAAYDDRNIKEENPTAEEIARWRETSGLPLRKSSSVRAREGAGSGSVGAVSGA